MDSRSPREHLVIVPATAASAAHRPKTIRVWRLGRQTPDVHAGFTRPAGIHLACPSTHHPHPAAICSPVALLNQPQRGPGGGGTPIADLARESERDLAVSWNGGRAFGVKAPEAVVAAFT